MQCRQRYLWAVLWFAHRIPLCSFPAVRASLTPPGLGSMQELCCVGKARPCRAHGLPMQEPSQASCPPGVKGLIPMFPGGLCDLLTPSGHRAGRKSKDALGMNKEAGMKPYGRTGDSSCPGSVLVRVSRGSSVLLQREKDVGHATSSFWRV